MFSPIMVYYGRTGSICGDGGEEKRGGKGYNEGDQVTVTINLETGQVMWQVTGQEVIGYKMEKLKRKFISWVPYIGMANKGDKVEILE